MIKFKNIINNYLRFDKSTSTLEKQVLLFQDSFRKLEKAQNYKSFLDNQVDCYIIIFTFGHYGVAGEVIEETFYKYLNYFRSNHDSFFIEKDIVLYKIKRKIDFYIIIKISIY